MMVTVYNFERHMICSCSISISSFTIHKCYSYCIRSQLENFRELHFVEDFKVFCLTSKILSLNILSQGYHCGHAKLPATVDDNFSPQNFPVIQ